MKKVMLILVLSLAPIAALLVSCGNSSPTSSSTPTSTPTPANTPTSTPTPSFKTLAAYSSAVSFMGICVDSSDNVYVADFSGAGTNSQLDKITSAGVTSLVSQINNVKNVAYDGANWYTGAGNSSPYFYYYSGGVTSSPISPAGSPSGLAINSNATTLALASGTGVTFYSINGGGSFTNVASFTLAANSTGPQALAFDNSGSLYVAENNLIVKYSVGASGSTTIAGQSGAGAYLDGAATTTAKFSAIQAIAVDNNGNVYIADTGNQAIRELSGSTVTTLVGPTVAGVSPMLTSPTLTGPEGIAVDGSGNVFFSDLNAHKIYEYIP
jgi:sugar lactone lactonase YvrE